MPRESQRDFARPLERASSEHIGVRIRANRHQFQSLLRKFRLKIAKPIREAWQQEISDYLDRRGLW